MCLAIPMRVESIENATAVVDAAGTRRTVHIGLVDDVAVGDYLLVHAGYAIARVDEDEARRTLDLLEELSVSEEGAVTPSDARSLDRDSSPPARNDTRDETS
jgi:hydrogenase expression/formation protein HypC